MSGFKQVVHCMAYRNWVSSGCGKVPQREVMEKEFNVLGAIHSEGTIDYLLKSLLKKVGECQGGSEGLVESRKEGVLQVINQDFPS